MTPAELNSLLQRLRLECDGELQAQYNRSLPFADGMFDRWERAERLGFDTESSIYDSACVFGEVRVGTKTWIGPYVMLDGSGGGISVGSTCSISAGVQIYTHDTVLWALSGGVLPARTGAVSIGDRVYIGSQSVIARGVTIGNMAVVAANSFVRDDVPSRVIVGGVPAVRIGGVEGEGEDVRLVFDSNVAGIA